MRNLIKKILREDFEWTEIAKPIELGDFDEDDVSYDDMGVKVYLGKEGEITYNISMDEFIEYVIDGHEDWTLITLVQSNGDYNDYHYDNYLDSDEINYMGGYLSEIQLERLQKILNHYGADLGEYKNLNDMISNDSLNSLETPMSKIYNGRHDWDDFVDESMDALGTAINNNRWKSSGEHYLQVLDDNKVDVTSYNRNEIQIVMAFPYEGSNNLSNILSNTGLNDYSWEDGFHEDWDPSGAEDDIRHYFSQMLDTIEEQIDEETNS